MPMYMYRCEVCERCEEEIRDRQDSHEDYTCRHCGATTEGKKAKLISPGIKVTYRQGSLKGRT